MKQKMALSFAFVLCLFSSSLVLAGGLKADFSQSRNTAGVNVGIDFSLLPDPGNGPIVSYKWAMGDGTEYVAMDKVNHSFQKPGQYNITLTIGDAFGGQAQVTKGVQILANEFPVAEFSYYDKKEIVVGNEIAFITSAKDADNNLEKYDWIIDTTPVSSFSGKIFVYKFANAGKYNVRHIVTDNLGAQAEIVKSITVLDVNIPPTLDVDFPTEVVVGELNTVKIKAKDPDGKIVSGSWSLSGYPEVPFTGNKFDVVFPYERDFLLTVKVFDDRGGVAAVSGHVFSRDTERTPVAKIKPSSEKVPVGKAVALMGDFQDSSGSLQEVRWDFGDGSTAITKDADTKHIFQAEGIYTTTATFVYGKQKMIEAKAKVEVLGTVSTQTTPTQLVIDTKNYIEIIPNEVVPVFFTAYSNASILYSYSTPTWNVSNGHIGVYSTFAGGAYIQGVSAGEATVSVTVDGITSQSITFKVVDFVNNAIVLQRGRFMGSNQDQFSYIINENSGTGIYYLTHSYMSLPWQSQYGLSSSGKIGAYLTANLPAGKDSILFSTTSNTYPYLKENLKIFNGRNGFMFFKSGTSLQIDYKDNRFVNWDHDFSITYWSMKGLGIGNSNVYQVLPWIAGSFYLQSSTYEGSIVLTGTNGYSYLNAPRGFDYYQRWTHMGLVYTNSTRVLQLYEDGEIIGSVTLPTGEYSSAKSITIGPLGSSDGAAIDELRFWGKALSSTEISNELFSPASGSSSDILADFNFDSGLDGVQESANGSGWTFQVQSIGTDSGTQPRSVPVPLIDQTVSSAQKSVLLAEIPFGEFAGKKVSLSVESAGFTTDQKILIQVMPCFMGCATEVRPSSILLSQRFSPYFYVNTWNNVAKASLLRIPFDVLSVSPSDIKKIKVMKYRLDGHSSIYEVFEPREINSFEGYVAVDIYDGGIFWVGIYDSYQPKFTNEDLKPFFGGGGGLRSFYTTLPTAQNSYTIHGESGALSSFTTTPSCSGTATITRYYDDLTISSLPSSGTTICTIQYQKMDGSNSYYIYDAFYVYKGN